MNVLDDFNRLGLCIEMDVSLSAERVVRSLFKSLRSAANSRPLGKVDNVCTFVPSDYWRRPGVYQRDNDGMRRETRCSA